MSLCSRIHEVQCVWGGGKIYMCMLEEATMKTCIFQNKRENLRQVCKRIHHKKATDIVQKLEVSISKVLEAFEVCPEIRKVAVLFGATPVSPKEIYLINMPPLNPDAENLSSKFSVKTLFHQLMLVDPLRELKQLSPTNMTVLLEAPRHPGLHWFLPKPTYSLPARGNHVQIHLLSNCGQGRHDLSKDFSVIELSGFEPFDATFDLSSDLLTPPLDNNSQSSEESVSADYVCTDRNENADGSAFDTNISCSNAWKTDRDSVHDDSEPSLSITKSCKRMKKSSSASSILSQTSVIAKGQRSSSCQEDPEFEEVDTGLPSFADPELMWFQSPVTMKGYRLSSKYTM